MSLLVWTLILLVVGNTSRCVSGRESDGVTGDCVKIRTGFWPIFAGSWFKMFYINWKSIHAKLKNLLLWIIYNFIHSNLEMKIFQFVLILLSVYIISVDGGASSNGRGGSSLTKKMASNKSKASSATPINKNVKG